MKTLSVRARAEARPFLKKGGAKQKKAVFSIPCGSVEGRTVDALALGSDEGRGMAAKSSGEMPNNRYIRKCPNGETRRATLVAVLFESGAYPLK